jgi:DNA-binding NtrC family response regulator
VKILMVDDDVKSLNMLAECLTSLGHKVCSAYTAENALEILKQEKPEVLLCDLDLSSSSTLDGDSIIARLKEISPDTIPIMLTGHTEEAVQKRLDGKGDIKVLYKPVDFEQLNMLLDNMKKQPNK